jgi:hypothetical protein
MEALLRDHYGAEGKDLSERINHASKRLPSGEASQAAEFLRAFSEDTSAEENERAA